MTSKVQNHTDYMDCHVDVPKDRIFLRRLPVPDAYNLIPSLFGSSPYSGKFNNMVCSNR
jgi:hypothetical protein